MSRVRASLLALGLACGAPLFAADDDRVIVPGASRSGSPAQASAPGGMGSVTLVLGLALAAAGGWLVWRNRRGTPIGRDHRLLAVDETRSLGNRQYLVVASYENRKFLIGVCPGRIDLLSPLDGAAPREKARE
ncbi:MAG: flagellar biosynthetic protein FliO [Opitutaceae bacterium]|nr:flagellar biosynthetic protein FliO [Opitutaceae bacterium]